MSRFSPSCDYISSVAFLQKKSRCLPPDLAVATNAWKKALPYHHFFFHDDDAVDRLFQLEWTEFPQLEKYMKCVSKGAMKIDVWRILILYLYGGIYTDVDNIPLQAFTEIARWFGTHSNIRVCDVTLFDTYGPGDRRAKLIPKLLKSALSGEMVEILTPDAEMNLCFIEDVVAAIAHIVARGVTGEWSVRAAANCRVAEVVSEIEAVTNRKVVEKFGTGQPHASPRLDGPPVLNDWSPVWSLRMGIEACWKSRQVVE